jgi:thiol:disulfide interchange protein DsbC
MKQFFQRVTQLVTLTFFASASASAFSADSQPNEVISHKIEVMTGLEVSSIADAPIAGLVQVMTSKGLFYVSKDANYLVQGRVYNIDEGMRNETEEALINVRKTGLESFNGDAIEFKAANEKYVVNVFTDVTCGYCRKLHNQIDAYNDLGITVRYLAFPRAGLGSKAYRDMVSVWCSDDAKDALTKAQNGEQIAAASCTNNVAEQYKFGQQTGVNGTPNIILPNGTVIPGYQPPETLLQSILES